MPERPPFELPVTARYASVTDASLTLADVSATTKRIVRAATDTAAAAALGVTFGTSRIEGDVVVAGQRPEEWIVLGPAPAVDAVVDDLDRSGFVSVIDHTHARALFRLTGDDASAVLAKLCALDLTDDMTPDGAVVSGRVAAVICDLFRADLDGCPSYLIACDRSFGQYLFDAILDAGAEFGIGVASRSAG